MDWEEDEWFAKYHSHNLTDEFKKWWLEYYGEPTAYDDGSSEQHEYWLRCAFALAGWVARAK